jgi:hypothetical protein
MIPNAADQEALADVLTPLRLEFQRHHVSVSIANSIVY